MKAKTNTNTTTAAAKATTTTRAAIAAAALKGCKFDALTCNAVRAFFPSWVDQYGKEMAKYIEKRAKSLVKAAAAQRTAQACNARDYLRDGAKVAAAAWAALMSDKDYKQGAAFARYLRDCCGYKDAAAIVLHCSQYISKDGKPCAKHIERDTEGAVLRTYYTLRNIESVGGYLAALKSAVNFAKRQAIQGRAKVAQVVVMPEIAE